jgi:hypothetical protein
MLNNKVEILNKYKDLLEKYADVISYDITNNYGTRYYKRILKK